MCVATTWNCKSKNTFLTEVFKDKKSYSFKNNKIIDINSKKIIGEISISRNQISFILDELKNEHFYIKKDIITIRKGTDLLQLLKSE